MSPNLLIFKKKSAYLGKHNLFFKQSDLNLKSINLKSCLKLGSLFFGIPNQGYQESIRWSS